MRSACAAVAMKECIDPEAILSTVRVMERENRRTLWGIAPNGPLHLAYDRLIAEQRELLDAGHEHVVLLADRNASKMHHLNAREVSDRASYYEYYFKHCCGLRAQFVRGSDFQSRPDYFEELLNLSSMIPTSRIKDASPRVAQMNGARKFVSDLGVLMQLTDVRHLNPGLILADDGQRKIYDLLEGIDEDLDRDRPRVRYVPLGHDIKGRPLNESRSSTRISIHETCESLSRKVQEMFAPPAHQPLPEGRVNALLEYFQWSVFPWVENSVLVKSVNGSALSFAEYESFADAYEAGLLHPNECKQTLNEVLWERLREVQRSLGSALTAWVNVEQCIGL